MHWMRMRWRITKTLRLPNSTRPGNLLRLQSAVSKIFQSLRKWRGFILQQQSGLKRCGVWGGRRRVFCWLMFWNFGTGFASWGMLASIRGGETLSSAWIWQDYWMNPAETGIQLKRKTCSRTRGRFWLRARRSNGCCSGVGFRNGGTHKGGTTYEKWRPAANDEALWSEVLDALFDGELK